jgi:DNA-binding transcriptional LysR family regulator
MQNRKIIDQMFEGAGIIPRALIETNCAVTLCSLVRSEEWFTIVPQSFLYLLSEWVQPHAIPLVAPVATNPIGLVIPERYPLPPIVSAFVEIVQSLNIEGELKKYAVPHPQTSNAA